MQNKEETAIEEALSLKLFVVLNRAQEAIRKKAVQDIKKHGLNLTEFGVLEFLYHKGEQPIQIIGKKVLLASSSITYVVDRLEEKGFIVRSACPKDRRVIYGRLTEAGKSLMADVFPKHQTALAEVFSSLDTEEKETAIALLKKVGLSAAENS